MQNILEVIQVEENWNIINKFLKVGKLNIKIYVLT